MLVRSFLHSCVWKFNFGEEKKEYEQVKNKMASNSTLCKFSQYTRVYHSKTVLLALGVDTVIDQEVLKTDL